MTRLLTILGTRPQIIKAAAFSRAVAAWNAAHSSDKQVEEIILHTGQHYDDNMSAAFFRELGIPDPQINLHVGSGSHGAQTARMIEGIEQVLTQRHYDGVVLYGDTNSTLAGAVAASKLLVPIFHIEAGLRSWNMTMPEEINRIVCDQLSHILFAPTQTAMDNLHQAGLDCSHALFDGHRPQRCVLSGDVMYDNSMHFAAMAEEKSDIIQRLGLSSMPFVLGTIHRPVNTDAAERLTAIFRAIADIADNEHIDIVLPLHPRTNKLLPSKLPQDLLNRIQNNAKIHIIPPASFFDIIRLERHAQVVLTDSGGVQKEAFFFSTPSIILREETEWIEIVNAGAGILADADYDRILAAYHQLIGQRVAFPPLFGNAHATERILEDIMNA